MVKINQKTDQTSLKTISQNPTQNSKVLYEDRYNTFTSSSKSKCSVSRCVCIQLLILLALALLAAIIIPIVVIVLDTQSSACAKTYSDSFTNGVTLASQCAAWQAFTSSLTCSSYSKMRLYGSNDPTGITVTDAATVTALAVALRYNTTIIAPSNGVQWRVWPCSGGYEISSTGTACSNPIGYVIRPCWPNGYWGGIMTANYPGPTQTMSISFE